MVLFSKDRLRLSDSDAWQPISPLNCDYIKLFASVVVVELTNVLPYLPSSHQSSDVPAQDSITSLSLVRDLLALALRRCFGGVSLSLDQRKGFDCMEHDFMFAVLEAYHFLDLFAGLMWVLYSDHRSTLIFSSRLTAPFSPTRGVRQGCSLSPLLDVLFLDPLLRRVVACASVRGFPCQVWDPFLSRCFRGRRLPISCVLQRSLDRFCTCSRSTP